MNNNSRYQPNRDPALVEAFAAFGQALANSPIDLLRAQAIGSYIRQAYDIYDGWARQTVGRPAVLCPSCFTSLDTTMGIEDVIACGECAADLVVANADGTLWQPETWDEHNREYDA